MKHLKIIKKKNLKINNKLLTAKKIYLINKIR